MSVILISFFSFFSFLFLLFFILTFLFYFIFIGVSYFSIGALTAGAIVYLFTTPLLVLTIPHVGYLFASVIIAGILLTHSYNEISTRVSLNLLVER